MATPITTFKKIMLDLDVSGTSQYSLTNDLSNNNTCFLEFNLMTNITNQNVTITFEQYTSQGGILENSETFTLNSKNNTLSRNINIITTYTLITINNNAFNGILSGFIEKLIIGNNISIDVSGQTVAVRGGVDISGQRVDISGQRINCDIFGLNNVSNNRLSITSTTTESTQSLDTYINNPNTTNYQNITGLNVYPNLMKFKTYFMDVAAGTGGFSVLSANGSIITNINNAALIFGASYLKNYFGQITGTGATNKSVLIDYVDASGNEIVAAPFTITTTNIQILTGIRGVNRVYLATNTGQQQLSTNESLNITYTQNSITIWAALISQYGEFCFSYTVPNGYVACLTQFQYWSQANEGLNINKFSANGTRFRLRTWLNQTSFIQNANMIDGGVSGFLSAGDTLLLSTEGTTSTSKRVLAMINAIKLS